MQDIRGKMHFLVATNIGSAYFVFLQRNTQLFKNVAKKREFLYLYSYRDLNCEINILRNKLYIHHLYSFIKNILRKNCSFD